MGALDGRVAIITGGGRGLGREHALLFAAEGAKVVVNDLGGDPHGLGADRAPAQQVVDEIEAMGGEAVAHTESCSDWEGAQRLVQLALDTFGDLHVLVNNAGILRDKMLVNMGPDEWDAVINVHLRGHFAPTRHAAAYWREQVKAGIAALTIMEAIELGRYGVRANAIAPVARTRLTLETPGMDEMVAAPEDAAEFDKFHPGNVSTLVAYLATADCPFNGGVFHVGGGEVGLFTNWTLPERLYHDDRWTVDELAAAAPKLLEGRPAVASEGFTIEETLAGFTD